MAIMANNKEYSRREIPTQKMLHRAIKAQYKLEQDYYGPG